MDQWVQLVRAFKVCIRNWLIWLLLSREREFQFSLKVSYSYNIGIRVRMVCVCACVHVLCVCVLCVCTCGMCVCSVCVCLSLCVCVCWNPSLQGSYIILREKMSVNCKCVEVNQCMHVIITFNCSAVKYCSETLGRGLSLL